MAFSISKQAALWLAIFMIVALILAVIQLVRVNPPPPATDPLTHQRTYTDSGPVIPESVEIEPRNFYSKKIELNRRAKLAGSFRTDHRDSKVVILLLEEADLEGWNSGVAVTPVIRTSAVPFGTISRELKPGVYFLIIDNKNSDRRPTVVNDFAID